MKRIFTFVLMLLTIFGLLGCNNGSTLENIDFNEQISAPINLKITGEVLSWDAVNKASGYIVYINDKKIDTVSKNSYDFSKKIENRMVFTVVTKAPRKMQDSGHSVGIAYLKNKTVEIALMKSEMAASSLNFGDEFAEELVNRGMLASEYKALIQAYDGFQEEIYNYKDINSYFDLINDMIEKLSLPEAFVSALVIHKLPVEIEDQISETKDSITYYTGKVNNPGGMGSEYYLDVIEGLQKDQDSLESLLDIIEVNPDEIIRTVMVVVDYLMNFEKSINDNFISKLVILQNSKELSKVNVTEYVSLKNELVSVLRESMPSQKEITLMIQTINSMSNIVEQQLDESFEAINYPEKSAAGMLMGMEAYINLLEYLDQDFIQSIIDINQSEISNYHKYAKLAILGMTYFKGYKDEFQPLLDEISNLYSEDEKRTIFTNTVQMYYSSSIDTSNPFAMIKMPSFETYLKLDKISQDCIDDFLNAFVKSKGQILLDVADFLNEKETNIPVTGDDYNQKDYNMRIYEMKIADQASYLINSVNSKLSRNDFYELRNYIIDNALMALAKNVRKSFVDRLNEYYEATNRAQYDFVRSLCQFLDNEDIFMDYLKLFQTTYQNNVNKISEEETYFNFIFLMRVYVDYMTLGRRADIDKIVSNLDIVLYKETIGDMKIQSKVPEHIAETLEYLDEIAKEIGSINPSSLTSTQKTRIDEILADLREIFESEN